MRRQRIGMGFQGLGLEAAQGFFDFGRKRELGLHFPGAESGAHAHFLQAGAPAVQAMMDFRVDEAADDAAAGDEAHAGQGDPGIDRPHLEARVREDEQRPE